MNFIKQTALNVGFDACGIARAEELIEDAEFMSVWLRDGNHAEMTYFERNFEKRTDPRKLVPGCKSVVVVLMNYCPAKIQNPEAPQIAKYAYSGVDYHIVIKSKLEQLEKLLCENYGSDCVSQTQQHIFVDSAPVLERRWAERAGLGWIGKNTQLIHPNAGSYCFIGILLLNIETEYDSPIASRCGNCTKCINTCPTNALTEWKLDARRCISFQTIENKQDIPNDLHQKLSNCVFGCDICATSCPWNKKWAKPHTHIELTPAKEILEWNWNDWSLLTVEKYTAFFKLSALKRAGFTKLK